MINLKDIKEIALANVVNPDSAYFYRFACRWFSKNFSTPLPAVYSLPPQQIYLAFFEESYEAMDEDDRLVEAMKAIDPEYEEKEEESIEDFINLIESEEQAKRDKGSINTGSVKKTEPNTSSEHKTLAPNTTDPIVRTYEDDTPEDEGL